MDRDYLDYTAAAEAIKAASKASEEQTKITNEMIAYTRQASEKFYYQIATIAGGAIVISLTFMGQLSRAVPPVLCQSWALKLSWVLLLVSLTGALFRNYYMLRFVHFSVMENWFKVSAYSKETILEEILKDPSIVWNLKNAGEVAVFEEHERKLLKDFNEGIKSHGRRAKISKGFFRTCEWSSIWGLLGGLACLIVFGIANL